MRTALLSRREAAIWTACFFVIAALLVLTHFASDDPDSALYAELSARLARLPPSHWIAPEWWGQWNSEGWFREHPAGVFFIPTVLAAIGVPAIPASYIVGVGLGAATVLLIGVLVQRVATREDARAALLLLQLMPVAFLFRIRANHEYPMLVCLLLAVIGVDGVRRSWGWTVLVAAAFTAGMLVKGVFIVMIALAAGLWALINPTRRAGSLWRPIVAGVVTMAMMGVTAVVYDLAYRRVTGEPFWRPYWDRQMGSVDVATPIEGASSLAGHAWFYLTRLLWHPAPWSVAIVWIAWRHRTAARAAWQTTTPEIRRGVTFTVAFAVLAVAILLPSSRFAERYAFSSTYAIAILGVVLAYRWWLPLRDLILRLDARMPALAAWLWLVLIVLRLTIGPLLPRIS